MRHVTEETAQIARDMRANGASWGSIERATGINSDVLRRRIDPAFIAMEAIKRGGPPSTLRLSPWRPTEDDYRIMRATLPTDTRSAFAKAMGDPLRGRSALDKKRTNNLLCAKSSDISTAQTQREYMEDRHSIEAVD